jgi:hypothetical protein
MGFLKPLREEGLSVPEGPSYATTGFYVGKILSDDAKSVPEEKHHYAFAFGRLSQRY